MNIKNFVGLKFLRWAIGLFFALGALVYIKESIITSASFFLLTIFTLPPLSDIPSSIIKRPINKPIKLIIGFLLFLIAVKFTPPVSESKSSTTQDSSSAIALTSIPTITSTLTTIPSISPTPTTNPHLARMVRVVDGDTIVVKINSQEETVRLIGIDTPEVVDPRKPVQCFGKEASEKIKELIQGKSVILTPDPTQNDKDNYGRLLRYVYLEDSTFINKKMIEEGYAFEYTYSIPYKYQLELKESQRQAKTNKLGLWADNACPTNTLVPTKKPTSLPQSTAVPQKPSSSTNTNVAPADTSSPGGSWACDCSKACGVMSSCAEAQYQLNSCGCQARDGDKDGIACDSDCQ